MSKVGPPLLSNNLRLPPAAETAPGHFFRSKIGPRPEGPRPSSGSRKSPEGPNTLVCRSQLRKIQPLEFPRGIFFLGFAPQSRSAEILSWPWSRASGPHRGGAKHRCPGKISPPSPPESDTPPAAKTAPGHFSRSETGPRPEGPRPSSGSRKSPEGPNTLVCRSQLRKIQPLEFPQGNFFWDSHPKSRAAEIPSRPWSRALGAPSTGRPSTGQADRCTDRPVSGFSPAHTGVGEGYAPLRPDDLPPAKLTAY